MMETKKLLKQIVSDSKKTKSLLAIYINKNEVDNFYVGYVVELFEDSILLDTFAEYGDNDGYLLIRLIDIFKVEKDSVYLNNLKTLINNNNEEKNETFIVDGQEGIVDIILICKSRRILLTIKLIYADYINGFVIEEDNDHFLIETYSKNGVYEGYSLINYVDIQNIHFDGKDEKKIMKLKG
jgi:hypothetical protein